MDFTYNKCNGPGLRLWSLGGLQVHFVKLYFLILLGEFSPKVLYFNTFGLNSTFLKKTTYPRTL